MTLTTPHTLLYDWDNTLVDTWPVIHQALTETFAAFGMEPWSMEQVKSHVARSMRDAFPDLFGERAEEAGELYIAAYRRYQFAWLKPLPGVLELLEAQAALPLKIGVVSNKRNTLLNAEIEHLGWGKYFDVIIGAGDAAHDKPDAAPALLALSRLGIAPAKEVWFIGDSNADLECAHNAALTPILYGELIEKEHDPDKQFYRGWGYAAYAAEHGELLGLIEQSFPDSRHPREGGGL